jgi:hypothetical protein
MTISWIFLYDGAIKKTGSVSSGSASSSGSQDKFRSAFGLRSFLREAHKNKNEIFLLAPKSQQFSFDSEMIELLGPLWPEQVKVVFFSETDLEASVLSLLNGIQTQHKVLVASASLCLQLYKKAAFSALPYENQDEAYLDDLFVQKARLSGNLKYLQTKMEMTARVLEELNAHAAASSVQSPVEEGARVARAPSVPFEAPLSVPSPAIAAVPSPVKPQGLFDKAPAQETESLLTSFEGLQVSEKEQSSPFCKCRLF